ncbi:MAG: hypothetical protein QOD93_4043 [Acetobacteraceae bacterium]|nr:hypothetical protein [Acetobacteraceae bacterium]
MDEPAVEQALTGQAGLFHHARGAGILDVAHGADAEDLRLSQCPGDDFSECLGHVSLAPMGPSEHVSEAYAMAVGEAQVEGASDGGVVAADQQVGSGDEGRCGDAVGDVGSGVVEGLVWAPGQEAGDVGVSGIGVEDRSGVVRCDRAEGEAGGAECVGKHGVGSFRVSSVVRNGLSGGGLIGGRLIGGRPIGGELSGGFLAGVRLCSRNGVKRGGRQPRSCAVSLLTMAINDAWNNRCGPGGSARRLHHSSRLGGFSRGIGIYGGETGSTRVVKTHLLPGMIPPLSGQITSANDNEALAVAA